MGEFKRRISPKQMKEIEKRSKKVEKERNRIKREKRVIMDHQPPDIGKRVVDTTEKILKFDPEHIIAIKKKGVQAGRLIQYCAEKMAGKKIPMTMLAKTDKVPGHIKENKKVAIVDDARWGENKTMERVRRKLKNATGGETKFKGFSLLTKKNDEYGMGIVWTAFNAIFPRKEEEMDSAFTDERVARFFLLKDEVDKELKKRGLLKA